MLDRTGEWVNDAGTSFSAPIVARACAFLWRKLRDLGGGAVDPFGVTVKACLALTAREPATDEATKQLARVSYGFGYPDVDRWFAPTAEHALFVWQGLLQAPNVQSRVQLPIPPQWLEDAADPWLRVVWCWDPPVNPAAPKAWICRAVELQVRPSNDEKAPALPGVSPRQGKASLRSRDFKLKPINFGKSDATPPADGIWTVHVTYTEIAELPDATYSSYQRVAVCAELVDRGGRASPQAALQAMPFTASMNRLGARAAPLRVGVGAR